MAYARDSCGISHLLPAASSLLEKALRCLGGWPAELTLYWARPVIGPSSEDLVVITEVRYQTALLGEAS